MTRGPIVILTFDPDTLDRFWLADYAPEVIAAERRRQPPIRELVSRLGSATEVRSIPVPADCLDGFKEAYYARPECFLDEAVRRAVKRLTGAFAIGVLSAHEPDKMVAARLDRSPPAVRWPSQARTQ